MLHHRVQIISIEKITPDVLRVVTTRPRKYHFTPGQATQVSVNRHGWMDIRRPFTFTGLPDAERLEFTIKTYPSHKGVTNQLLGMKTGDEIFLHAVFGSIRYKGEGTFIAGGAGVTPFVAILRFLGSKHEIADNRLVFANKTKADIILREEFETLLGDKFVNVLSDELVAGYANGHITRDLIRKNSAGLNRMFYLCGPPPMMDEVQMQLDELGVTVDCIVKEAF